MSLNIRELKIKIKNNFYLLFIILRFIHRLFAFFRNITGVNRIVYFIARLRGMATSSNKKFTTCICGYDEYRVFLNYGKYKIFECTHCGLKRTSPLPKESVYSCEEIVESYLGDNKEYMHPQIMVLLNEIIKLTSKNDRIIDVGCGDGKALNFLNKVGYNNLFGIEIGKFLNELARKRNIAKIFDKSLEDCKIDKPFKLIYLNHVFEHVFDIKKFLRHVESNLDENGYFIVASPNIDSFFALSSNWGYSFTGHYWHFTDKTMKKVVENNSNLQMKYFLTMRGDKFWKINLFKKMRIKGDVVCMVFTKK